MQILLIANNPSNWPVSIPGVEVVAARKYLTDPVYSTMRNVRVFNVCRSYSYQSLGYYVSLLAEARGHKPIPDVITIQDMKSSALVRVITDDLDRLIQKTLRPVAHDSFTMSIYFGHTLAQRDRAMGQRLFGLFRAPLLRAQFAKKDDQWSLQSIRPISTSEIADTHRSEVVESAKRYFKRGHWNGTRTHPPRYHLAILVDQDQQMAASDSAALDKFAKAARKFNVGTEQITKDDFGRIGEFDALFIRATTYMNHYTYRFSRRAAADGLAVIDDPVSIARCTNKVYLAERLAAAGVSIPRTMILHRDNLNEALEAFDLPVVLKQPDSSFSVGVVKASTPEEFREKVAELLKTSELVIAQPFIRTSYDWRIGILDGKPLYACKYYMARNHWQIYKHNGDGHPDEGNASTMPIENAPKHVVATAVKSAKVIGDGLYGVDLKEIDGKVYVIEVNDNPSIDAGVEDRVLKDTLYESIIESFIRRIEDIRAGAGQNGARKEPASV